MQRFNTIDFSSPEFKQLVVCMPSIPVKLLKLLQYSAQQHGISLEQEITARLILTFVEPIAFGTSLLFRQIYHYRFSCESRQKQKEDLKHQKQVRALIYSLQQQSNSE